MQTYYSARVVEAKAEGTGFPVFHVELITASEDGYELYGTVKYIWDKKQADNLAAFWSTGGSEMVMTIMGGEIEFPNPHDAIPDPSDIAEMQADAYGNT